jgi:hypothetical protein
MCVKDYKSIDKDCMNTIADTYKYHITNLIMFFVDWKSKFLRLTPFPILRALSRSKGPNDVLLMLGHIFTLLLKTNQ